MNLRIFTFLLVVFGTFPVTGIAGESSSITTVVDGRSGPWNSALNPSFSWGTSVLPPTVIDSSTGLPMTIGDTLTISYIDGITNGGGGGIFSDANGNAAFGDVAGNPGAPSQYITSQGPVYFMALLGAFTNSNDVIVGSPFKIGNGPFSAIIPQGASKLSMGVNDGGGGFFDNGGGLTIGITEAAPPIPEPEAYAMLIAGLALIGIMANRRRTVGEPLK